MFVKIILVSLQSYNGHEIKNPSKLNLDIIYVRSNLDFVKMLQLNVERYESY